MTFDHQDLHDLEARSLAKRDDHPAEVVLYLVIISMLLGALWTDALYENDPATASAVTGPVEVTAPTVVEGGSARPLNLRVEP